MNRFLFASISLVLVAGLLGACGPSEEEEQATATQIAANAQETQTALAPTSTPEPTSTSTPTDTPTPAPTATAVPTPTPPSVLALLETAFEILETSESYRSVIEGNMTLDYLGMSIDINSISDYVNQPPDRAQGVVTMEMLGEVEETENIIIGTAVYTKDPNTGDWQLDSGAAADFNFTAISNMSKDVEQLIFVGEETLDGIPVFHLRAVKTDIAALFEAFFPADLMDQLTALGGSIDAEADIEINYWIAQEEGHFIENTLEGEMTIVITDQQASGESIEMSFDMDNKTRFSEYNEPVLIEAPELPTEILFSTPYGTMTRYETGDPPFSIAYPAEWLEQQSAIGETARYANEAGDIFVVAVEDVLAEGLGEMTVEDYADLVITQFESSGVIQVLARNQFVTEQNTVAQIITFAVDDETFKGKRFVFVIDDQYAFSATYFMEAARFDQFEPLLDYSFASFWSGEPREKITVWHGWGGNYYNEIEAVIMEYGSTNDISIELRNIYTGGAVQVDLSQAVLSGNGPDILAWWVSGQMEGSIVPITDWFDEGHQFANFEPAAADATIWQGDVWSIPLSQEGIAIVYNKDLISEDELPSDPADFEGLLNAAIAFREANPDKYLLCNQGIGIGSLDTYHVAPVYFGFGGDDEPGFIDGEGSVHVDTPERLEAAEWLLDFAAVAPEQTSHTICLDGIKNGTFAAWWTGPWAIADLEAAGIDYAILPFGRPFMSIKRLMMGTNAVDRGNEEAVIGLLNHLGSAEIQARLALVNGTIPANTEALRSPEIQQVYTIDSFGKAIATGIPIGNSLYPDVQWDPIAAMTSAILSGDQTPEEALAMTQAEMERIIESLESE